MTASLPALSSLLRACLLALLVLGIVVKPMLASLCEVHALGHALAAHDHGMGHDHDHDHGHDRDDGESMAEHQIDDDHASGAHGLLHEGDSDGAYADTVAVIVLPAIPYEPLLIPMPTPSPFSGQLIAGPFRPPIA